LKRRAFLKLTGAVFAARAARAARADRAGSTAGSAATPGVAYVGTYTPNGGGIYAFRVDSANGALTQFQVEGEIENPSWLALNQDQSRLYAVSEIDHYLGAHSGAVASYAIDPRSSRLTRIGIVDSRGASPAHVSVHPTGRFVFVANYGGGNVAVFPVGTDGSLGEASDVRPSVGPRHQAHSADDPPGQFAISDHEGPHLHMVAADPSGSFVIANDAGLDLTLVWRFDAQAGRLLPADVPVIAAPAGSAPRHFVFHPNGRSFYNLYEHDAVIAVYDYDAARGALRFQQSIATLPPKFAGSNLASEIVIAADGRYLYAANRLHDAIASFAIAADGRLRWLGDTWVHGDYPRSIALAPNGAYLYACNQKGDSIASFKVNAVTGGLQFTGRFAAVGSPAVMVMPRRGFERPA
jgi:6-phosphogluconolactonase (cycloisomerase 2 family)